IFSRDFPAKEEVAADLRRRILVDLPDMSPEVREVIYCRILPFIETPEFVGELLEFTKGSHEERMVIYCQMIGEIDRVIDWDDVRACISKSTGMIHRKRARWLLERVGGPEVLNSTWQWYWALVESLDEFACHMFKELFTPKLLVVASEASKVEAGAIQGWKMSSLWVEALLEACLNRHDNEAIPKHVLTELGAHPELAMAVLSAVDPQFFCSRIVRAFDENLAVFCNGMKWYARPEKAVGGGESMADLVNSYVQSGGKISLLLKEVLEGLVNYTSTRVFLEAIGNAEKTAKEPLSEETLGVCLRFATTRVKYFKTALRPKILRLFTAAIEASFKLPSEDILAKDSFQLNLVRFYAILCSFDAPVPQRLVYADLHARWMPKVLSDTSSEDLTVELVSGVGGES
ncbi:hypothetical protein FOZ63_031091, partial [Perkinsus olseni]